MTKKERAILDYLEETIARYDRLIDFWSDEEAKGDKNAKKEVTEYLAKWGSAMYIFYDIQQIITNGGK